MSKSIGNMYKSSTQSLQNALLLLLFVIGLFILYRYVKTLEGEVKMIHNHVIELGEQMRVISESTVGQNTCPMPSKRSSKKQAVVENLQEVAESLKEFEGGGAGVQDEDNESVKSEDITNILRQVINSSIMDDETDGDIVASAQSMFSAVFTATTEEPVEVVPTCTITEEPVEVVPTCTITEVVPTCTITEDSVEEIEASKANEKEEASTTQTRLSKTMNIDYEDEASTLLGGEKVCDDKAERSNESHKDDLLKKTNEELRTILKNNHLSVKGAKSELVERIMENNIF